MTERASVPFQTVDVFTNQRFGGNPLAVMTDASMLTTDEMQAITREFNYAESTFLLPATDDQHDAILRIFTPAQEIPFAGHPNIGTAYVWAMMQGVQPDGTPIRIRFSELIGTVVIEGVWQQGQPTDLSLTAAVAWTSGDSLSPARLAAALGLREDQISTEEHLPIMASSGLPFLIAELIDADSVDAAVSVDAAAIACNSETASEGFLLYARKTDGSLHARMLSPKHGIKEDPATGSAACALAGLLLSIGSKKEHHWIIHQGTAMGRPSLLNARAWRDENGDIQTGVGGSAVLVITGQIQV